MIPKYHIIILTYTTIISSEIIKVLKTTNDLSLFQPKSGAHLSSSSFHGEKEVTICTRFVTYQFTAHGYEEPRQILLQYGETTLLSSYAMLPPPSRWRAWYVGIIGNRWQNGNVLGYSDAEKDARNVFTAWKIGPNIWNHACLISSKKGEFSKIIINGETVHRGGNYEAGHVDWNNDLVFMGNADKEGYTKSLFGEMTDVNIWNRSLTDTEVMEWTQCKMKKGGNLLDWSTA